MHPLCDSPGCGEESVGQVSVFRQGWEGGFYYKLCDKHMLYIVATFPGFMARMAKDEQS